MQHIAQWSNWSNCECLNIETSIVLNNALIFESGHPAAAIVARDVVFRAH